MEFRKTEGSLVSLKEYSSINVEEMLELLSYVVIDCFHNLGVNDVSGMQVSNQKMLVLRLNAIASMILQVAKENAGGIDALKSSVGSKHAPIVEKTIHELEEVNEEYDKIRSAVEKMVEMESQLEDSKSKLEGKRREYLQLEGECKSLQEEIDALDNASLEEIEEKKISLANDLAERQSRKNKLDKENCELEDSLKTAQSSVATAEAKRSEIKNGLRAAEKEKERLRDSIEKLQEELEEIEKWNRDFPEIHKAMLAESKSHETMMAQLRTSMNGIFSDEFLTETLVSTTGKMEKLTPENYPDLNVVSGKINSVADLKQWADNVMKRIQSLLDVYQEELRRLVEYSNYSMNADEKKT